MWWAELAAAQDRANAFATKEMHTESRAKAAEDKLEIAIKALEKCEFALSQHIRGVYSPAQVRLRQRDFSNNPARIALDAILTPAKENPIEEKPHD